nr:hypothetical protein Iba_chr13cCG18210 [Ipomoea batatas]
MAAKSAKLRVISVADSIPTGLTMIEAQIWWWAEGYSYTAMAAKKPGSMFAPPRYGSDRPMPDKSAHSEENSIIITAS